MNSEPDVVLKVEGMMCQNNCGTTVQKALSNVPKVTKVVVSFAKKEAQIWGSVSSSVLINAVASVGFDATVVMQQQPTANASPNMFIEEEILFLARLLKAVFK